MQGCLVLFVVLLTATAVSCQGENTRPVIGIWTQPTGGSTLQPYGDAYLAASYVKFFESGGARVIPLNYSMSEAELTEVFYSINGMVFPGGGWQMNGTWGDAANFMFQLALKANAQGDYFPVWGTCWGFQVVNMLVDQNFNLLQRTNSENITLALDFVVSPSQTRMFANAPADVIETLSTWNVTMNNHQFSVYSEAFYSSLKLTEFFTPITTNLDRDGIEFISTVEGKNVPVYATQWHPEKPIFEWRMYEVMNHTTASVRANQYMADFFVSECRKSMHSFASQEVLYNSLIYNYPALYTENIEPSFEQCYMFNYEPNPTSSTYITPVNAKNLAK